MRTVLSGALAGALLAPACASRVTQPPAPPHYEPAPGLPPALRLPAQEPEAERAPSPVAVRPPAPEPVAGSAPSSRPARPSAREDPPLGWIAGQPLEAEELLLEWGDVASRDLFLVLDKLVAARLALAEADRLGIRLAPEVVEERCAAERAKLEREVARGGKGRTVEEFVERELGFEPARFLERFRRATIRQMLAERAVRAASLEAENVALRVIVVAGPAEAEKVREALAKGRDFAEVARELSLDDSKEDGGLVPFVALEERLPLARLASRTPVGEVAGPVPVSDHQFWIRVEERRAPLSGDWSAIGTSIEDSLERNPVRDSEFAQWRLQMERRYPIDLGPLWSLIGAVR
jgi:hypothetical protein